MTSVMIFNWFALLSCAGGAVCWRRCIGVICYHVKFWILNNFVRLDGCFFSRDTFLPFFLTPIWVELRIEIPGFSKVSIKMCFYRVWNGGVVFYVWTFAKDFWKYYARYCIVLKSWLCLSLHNLVYVIICLVGNAI